MSNIELIPLDQIDPNPYQPRLSVDPEQIQKLARGLRIKRDKLPETCGLMQVPMGRRLNGRIELAFGHRRLEAFRYNHSKLPIAEDGDEPQNQTNWNWDKLPIQIVNLSDEEMYDFAARENGDREEINDIEKAKSIKLAMEKFKWDLTRASNAHGLSKSAGSNLTRLLLLPDEVQAMMTHGMKKNNEITRLGQRQARELIRLIILEPPEVEKCKFYAKNTIIYEWSAKEIEFRIDEFIKQTEKEKKDAELAKQKETRYCPTCGASTEFNGVDLKNLNSHTCIYCGYKNWPAQWSKNPPTCTVCNTKVSNKWQIINFKTPPSRRWVCNTCDKKTYENTPCLHCNGKVYYAKYLENCSLKCETCQREWEYTQDFRNEVIKANKIVQRYCHTCGEPTEMTHKDATTLKNIQCKKCGTVRAAKYWEKQPPTNLPDNPLVINIKEETVFQENTDTASPKAEEDRPTIDDLLNRFNSIITQARIDDFGEIDAWLDDLETEFSTEV